jgi:hypothetical protein
LARVEGLRELQARFDALGKNEIVLKTIQIATIREAKILVHRKTGHLGRSIVPGAVHKDSIEIDVRTPYAAAVELGAKPHVIRPKKGKVLAWGGTRRLSGALAKGSKPTHFARLVHHPGNKPYPYLLPGARKAVAGIKDVVVRVWNKAA